MALCGDQNNHRCLLLKCSQVMIAECWAKDRATRPSFSMIATRLEAMAKQFPDPIISPSVIQVATQSAVITT